MSLIGGARAGLGGVRTTGEASGTGGTPTPTPEPQLVGVRFDLPVSFGHGIAADQNLPAATSFWLSPTTIADLAVADQSREWLTQSPIGFLYLDMYVDAANLVTAGARLIVTVNGLDTPIGLDISTGVTTAFKGSTSALFTVDSGSVVGIRFDGSALGDGSTLRLEARLRGYETGTPFVPSELPADPLALFLPEDLAVDGETWVDSVTGNLYTCTVPTPSGPPPPGIEQISGPTWTQDGSFNNHPYAYFKNYNGPLGQNYTPNMLATSVSMFAGSVAPPIAPRTYVVVCKADDGQGGILASGQYGTPCFEAAWYKPAGDLQRAAYFNQAKGSPVTCEIVTDQNLAGNELVLIWRTDGTTVEFFINGVKQPLVTDLVGADFSARTGFTIGNLASAEFSSRDGFRGSICFEGVWARSFTDNEVLSATSYCTGEFTTP